MIARLGQTSSYLSPKLRVRYKSEQAGQGVYANEPVDSGELLAMWTGSLFTSSQVTTFPRARIQRSLQVEDDLHLVSIRLDEPADFINHNCNPNAGLEGQVALRALRDIAAHEEVCFDYAMSECNHFDDFDCACGASNCRGRFTGDDWRSPSLQLKYLGWFSPHMQRRIDRIGQTQVAANAYAPNIYRKSLTTLPKKVTP